MVERAVANNDFKLTGVDRLSNLSGWKNIHKISNIHIEISGKCNAKCPYCARQHFGQRYAGKNMSPILFEKILGHLVNIGLLHRDHKQKIYLFNWGEPFLNPEINDILEILKKYNLSGCISSNFIKLPEISCSSLPILSDVVFSLSGFSQDSYGKIHGACLATVLDHFEDFYKKVRKYSPSTKINVAWHRYTFNEIELWNAYKYFRRPGINFFPAIAYFNDLPEMLNYAEGMLSDERLRQAENDLFLDHISEKLSHHKKKSKHYPCFMWNYLVIDEIGQLLLCCGISRYNVGHVLGNVLEMSSEEIREKKLSDLLCRNCISSGVPRAIGPIGYKRLPIGGKGSFLKLWYQLNIANGYMVGWMIRDLPWVGEFFFRTLMQLKKYYMKLFKA
jgi:MoaA/NifB/PqqE/SkfB family radical SAM enzyme